ncbi:molybdopterin cofactor-binding domain-containing protein [Methylobacterium oryzae CBMB20]
MGRSRPSALGAAPECVRVAGADTDLVGHDTGAYGSTGTVVAGLATLRAAEALAVRIRARAAEIAGAAPEFPPAWPGRRSRRRPDRSRWRRSVPWTRPAGPTAARARWRSTFTPSGWRSTR